ncbi:PSD1 and planctomycete cytochrome C domain-containing protein [uncultured Gimesia sp.]|uniref:PSD1 and planctomycete cytochrome C domain-containing protein n=1 Tax=uncultured Gimesia sp. TaxID=1678688 RepID=UPI0030DC1073|tara:strand:+ start:51901 stop:54717 length:2817 start_codon:yes stop_codon:yes gene_type:complete
MRVLSSQPVRKLSLLICFGMIIAIQSGSGFLFSEETKISPMEQFFLQKIRPLLEQKCLGCHGKTPDDIKGEYIMLNREALIKGGESGEPSIIVGKPEQSPFWNAVTWKDENIQMPPQERNRLNAAEIADLKQWIADGAVWSDQKLVPSETKGTASGTELAMSTSGGQSPTWTGRTYQPEDIWAYQSIQRPAVPWKALTVKQSGERHPIDAFIQQKLQQKQLVSSKPADRKTLLRRATYDLTGLPPTAKQVTEFFTSDGDAAWSSFIKRLLQTPQYGEQMAQTWIDVVRYADTSGFANDYERPNAWRYRDYLVRSFNADKPYDRFIIEQLAGDELDSEDPEMLFATGFLRSGPWEHTGMSVAAITRQLFLDDITQSVGVSFLAHSFRCAKCHDHKFDPVPTRDYYRIQAVFAPVQFADRKVAYQSHENISGFAEMKVRTERLIEESRAEQERFKQKTNAAIAAWLKKEGFKNLKQVAADKRPPLRWFGLTEHEKSLLKINNKRIDYFERELKRYEPYAFSVYNGPPNNYRSTKAVNLIPGPKKKQREIQQTFILAGGAVTAPTEKVTPGVLSAVAGSNNVEEPNAWNTIPNSQEGRRLALARWIASSNNTLTARVIVNRIWQIHFGTGLVATPNNFGQKGAKPSHPELLDWLATWFMDHGWSIKKLHHLIMTSNTYQQSSHPANQEQTQTQDPNNQFLSHYPTRRMTAEQIRDSLLLITNELNPEMGGPGVFPEINWEVALQPRHIMGSVAPAYQPMPRPEQRNRRTLYAFRYRTLSDPMLEVFNRPGSESSCERRDETTVTPQAFALFNGQFTHDRAVALAHKIKQETASTPEAIKQIFQAVVLRTPEPAELTVTLKHVADMQSYHQAHPPQKVSLPREVKREMIEELTGESFTWTEKLDLTDNYIQDLKPWDVDAETRALAELCLVLMNSNEFVYLR